MSDLDPVVREFLAAYAHDLGVDAPTDDEIDALLALAAVAAHASARQAAPIACWLAARAGVSAAAGREAVERLAARRPTGHGRA